MIKNIFLTFCICITICVSNNAFSQTDTTHPAIYEDLSLKELLSVKIVSVSKQSELLFEAPLSASVVTKEEIRRTGCTSIMEGLRLVPGMIVKEQSNGNYDIHMRGMDNIPPNAPFDVSSNTTMLVMIDNRPIYSYLMGGTFWETLPVDINDVEKIEVVRGPAAALYGPNAVNGVINIITRKTQKKGLYAVVNSQQGNNKTFIENASLGYRFSKKLGVITSGNYQYRDRAQTSYYEYNRNTQLNHPDYFITFNNDTVRNVDELHPDPALAMKKYAGNIFLDYTPSKKIQYTLSAGLQHSWAQRVSTENDITPLSNVSSDSRYADFHANILGLSAQVSYNKGTQTVDFNPGNKYDYNILDANVEYSYSKNNFSLKPGLSYRKAIYDDTKYSDVIHRGGIFNTRGVITTQSAFLRAEYKLFNNKLRLVAGAAGNIFNYPDTTYLAYQFAGTYKINKRNLFRAVYSHAPRSSNVFDTYVDQATVFFPSGYRNFTEIAIVGNKNLKLLTANMLEVGYRTEVTNDLAVDVELFDMRSKNFNVTTQSHPVIEFDGTDTVHETPIIFTNLPLKLKQFGATVSLTYSSKKLQLKPFVTLQQTRMANYSSFLNTPDAAIPGAEKNNIYSGMGTEEKINTTPSVFGGAYINYIPVRKINVNVNSYYYSSQTYYHVANIIFNDGVRGIGHITAKLIVNATVSYEPTKGLEFFGSGKNILNDKAREFYYTDAVPARFLAGVNYEF